MGYAWTNLCEETVGSFSETNPPVRGFGGVWGDFWRELGSYLAMFWGDRRHKDMPYSGRRSGHDEAWPSETGEHFGLPEGGIWGISPSLPGVPLVPGRIEISNE